MTPLLTRLIDAAVTAACKNGINITREMLISRTRVRPVPQLRYMIMSELMDMGWSTTVIGRITERNHSTVSHAKQFIRSIESNRTYGLEKTIYDDFKKLIADSDGQEERG